MRRRALLLPLVLLLSLATITPALADPEPLPEADEPVPLGQSATLTSRPSDTADGDAGTDGDADGDADTADGTDGESDADPDVEGAGSPVDDDVEVLGEIEEQDNGEHSFADLPGTFYEDAVAVLYRRGIVQGCAEDTFCAGQVLTRGQVATILDRALGLPSDEVQLASSTFVDTAGNVHASSIESVARAGLAAGCAEDRFCPDDPITRAQLATVLQAAFDLGSAPSGQVFFRDRAGVHQDAVNSITAAGVSNGCSLVHFCPGDHLIRGHAAVFIARALQLIPRVEVAPFAEREAQYEQLLAEEQAARRAAEEEALLAEQEAIELAQQEADRLAAEAEANAPHMRAVQVALAQLGKPYRWGAAGPHRFDCSGLMYYSWRQVGVTLPRSSRAQHGGTQRISRSELRPGDLVFYHSPISHVAMYIGDGRVVDAPGSGRTVRIRNDGLTRRGVVGFGRVRY